MIDFRKLYNTYDREDLINTCVNLKHNKERLSKEVNKSYIVCGEKDKEIERLNNIINELDKVLNENVELTYVHNGKRQYNKTLTEGGLLFRDYIKSKLQELKGDGSSE